MILIIFVNLLKNKIKIHQLLLIKLKIILKNIFIKIIKKLKNTIKIIKIIYFIIPKINLLKLINKISQILITN